MYQQYSVGDFCPQGVERINPYYPSQVLILEQENDVISPHVLCIGYAGIYIPPDHNSWMFVKSLLVFPQYQTNGNIADKISGILDGTDSTWGFTMPTRIMKTPGMELTELAALVENYYEEYKPVAQKIMSSRVQRTAELFSQFLGEFYSGVKGWIDYALKRPTVFMLNTGIEDPYLGILGEQFAGSLPKRRFVQPRIAVGSIIKDT